MKSPAQQLHFVDSPLGRGLDTPLFAEACAWTAAGIAATVVLGWLLQMPAMIELGIGAGAMAPNTAVSLLAAAAALILAMQHGERGAGLARGLALVPLLLGAATWLQYTVDVDLGIDQLLIRDAAGLVSTGHPGRMPSLTAVSLVLAGAALLTLDSRADRRLGSSAWFGVALGIVAAFALFGLGYDAPRLMTTAGVGGIAFSTIVALLALALGIVASRPTRGPMRLILAEGEGGLVARRLLPVAVLLPPVLGWLLLHGVERGLYGEEGLATLTATTTLLLLGVFGWLLAKALDSRFRVRQAAAERLRHSELMLNRAQEASHVGGWEIDVASGRIAWTREVYRIHEVPLDHDPNNLARNLDFYAPGDRERLGAAVAAACEHGEPWDLESEFRTALGNRRWVATSGRAERAGGRIVRVHGHIADITERKRIEQELRDLNATLDRRVEQRTEQLSSANKDLEGFSYSVSHDLRAPLRAIDSFSKILLDEHGARLDDEGQRMLQAVRRNAVRMARLIDDILEFSRAGRRALMSAPVDMRALCTEVVAELEPPAGVVQIADLPAATGDRAMLRQVLVNLLGNAIKFSGRQAQPCVRVEGVQQAETIAYAVADNGAGFDPAYAHKLFGVFQRLHGGDEFPGTGIGLAIVKRIVDKHGGRVWAEGTPGAGATFHFSLPRPPGRAETST